MDNTMTAELTKQEAAHLSDLLEEGLAIMQQARVQMDQDLVELEQSQTRTWALIDEMRWKLNVEKSLGVYSAGFPFDRRHQSQS